MHDVQPQPVKSRSVMGAIAILAVLVLLVAGGAVVFAQAPRVTSGSLPINGLDATAVPGGAAADASESPGESSTPAETATPGETPTAGESSAPTGSPAPGKECVSSTGAVVGGGMTPGITDPGVGPGIRLFHGARGVLGGLFGGLEQNPHRITVTAIDGNNVSLATDDGWTRTVDASGATVTRDCEAATLADLKVGDTVRIGEKRNDDGTYTVTDIAIVTPTVTGTVTATAADGFTLAHLDGTAVQVHVTADTKFTVSGVPSGATQENVQVGNLVLARGTLRDDGSMDATDVWVFNGAGPDRGNGPHGPWRWGGWWGPGPGGPGPGNPGQPGESPAPTGYGY